MGIYHAIIEHSGPNEVHKRVTLKAADLDEAKRRLEARFGVRKVVSLWGEVESQRVR